jgi:hypothetical protein
VLGTKVGRLVAAEFADPSRLAALGSSRFIRFGATRGLQIRRPTADKLVAAARHALPMPDAAVARAVLAADLALLAADLALLGDLDAPPVPTRREVTLRVVACGNIVRRAVVVAARETCSYRDLESLRPSP